MKKNILCTILGLTALSQYGCNLGNNNQIQDNAAGNASALINNSSAKIVEASVVSNSKLNELPAITSTNLGVPIKQYVDFSTSYFLETDYLDPSQHTDKHEFDIKPDTVVSEEVDQEADKSYRFIDVIIHNYSDVGTVRLFANTKGAINGEDPDPSDSSSWITSGQLSDYNIKIFTSNNDSIPPKLAGEQENNKQPGDIKNNAFTLFIAEATKKGAKYFPLRIPFALNQTKEVASSDEYIAFGNAVNIIDADKQYLVRFGTSKDGDSAYNDNFIDTRSVYISSLNYWLYPVTDSEFNQITTISIAGTQTLAEKVEQVIKPSELINLNKNNPIYKKFDRYSYRSYPKLEDYYRKVDSFFQTNNASNNFTMYKVITGFDSCYNVSIIPLSWSSSGSSWPDVQSLNQSYSDIHGSSLVTHIYVTDAKCN
ncbi:hypothetical protein [Aquella oligotrophica]|uniref:Uncharacterized protein n=1 Tax=Aquella oligotrophica TaxID=2067065 RepID=A0A2I7N8K4_9NEIS|nr:hypothetical protein [Aquella oligotrophica]AUR52790.1 hypothetical protein CUN60_10965 [Aquella oligotrophica]